MTRSTATKWVIVLCLIGLALRIGLVLSTRSYVTNPGAIEHEAIATSLVTGHGFSFGHFGYYGPTSVQSPTYPLFLAGIFELFGIATPASYLVAMIVNCLVGMMVIWLTYRLAREMGGSRGVGVLAAALCTIWPTQIYASNFAQAVTWIIAGFCAVMLLFLRSTRTGKLGPWLLYSLIGTFTALTEPVLLPVMALSGVLILFWPSLGVRVRLRNAGVLLGMTVIVIGPWTLRNYRVHHEFMPIKSTFWVNVWKGANDYASGTDRLNMDAAEQARLNQQWLSVDDSPVRRAGADELRQYSMLDDATLQRIHNKTDVQREKVFKELASNWIASHPRRYVELCGIRLWKTLWIDFDNPKSHNLAYVASRAAVLALSIAGLVVAVRKRWRIGYPLLVMGICLLTYTLTLTAARFSMPFEPLQLCLGAGFLVSLLGLLCGRKPACAKLKSSGEA